EQRRGRGRGDVAELEDLLAARDLEQPVARGAVAGELERKLIAIGADQANLQRDQHRLLSGLARSRRNDLAHGETRRLGMRIVVERASKLRRAALRVPKHELGKIAAGGVGHGPDEILDGHRLAVMALEIQVEALAEAI